VRIFPRSFSCRKIWGGSKTEVEEGSGVRKRGRNKVARPDDVRGLSWGNPAVGDGNALGVPYLLLGTQVQRRRLLRGGKEGGGQNCQEGKCVLAVKMKRGFGGG